MIYSPPPQPAAPKWFLGDPPKVWLPGGFRMHVGSGVHDTVAFLGFEDPNAPGGIKCEGTGFFLLYADNGYLVTARHVAEIFNNDPFVIRVNRHDGGAQLIHQDQSQWYHHPDPAVDLSLIPLEFRTGTGLKCKYLPEHFLLSEERIKEHYIDVGDACYTVGLFHFIYGQQSNFPLVFTGNIALMPPRGRRYRLRPSKIGQSMLRGI
jgi:hypothetical protein